MLRKRGICVVMVMIAISAALVLYYYVPWGERLTEIDVNSGRVRVRVFLLGFMIRSEEKDTPFSQLVAKYGQKTSPAKYVRAAATDVGSGRMRVCYTYGAALGPMYLLAKMLKTVVVPREEEGAIVARMIEKLRRGDTEGMRSYITDLMDAYGLSSSGRHPVVNH